MVIIFQEFRADALKSSGTRFPQLSNMTRELQAAAFHGDLVRFKSLLIQHKADPSVEDQWCFLNACLGGHPGIVDILLRDKRVDPGAQRNQGFMNACRSGHALIVKMLLRDPRVNPTDQGGAALDMCYYHGQMDCLALLLADERFKKYLPDSLLLH